jgi:hypothetical protein
MLVSQSRYGITIGGGTSRIDNYKLYFNRNINNGPYDVIDYPYENLISWNVGFYYIKSYQKSDIDFGGEFLLNGMGAYIPFDSKIEADGTVSYQDSFKERLIYLSVPLFLRYNVGNCWFLQGGITNSILISKPPKPENWSDTKPYDLGGNLAFGVRLFPKINIEIQGYHSLIRINHVDETIEEMYDNRLFNSSITVSLKYELGQRN